MVEDQKEKVAPIGLPIRTKKLCESAKMPYRKHTTDAGWDLTATSKKWDDMGNVVYGTGLAMEIPEGYVGLLFPRSSIAEKHLTLSNSVGVIDSGYRGEIKFKFRPMGYRYTLWDRIRTKLGFRCYVSAQHSVEYKVGERIGQIIIMPYPQVMYVDWPFLSESDRGAGGYGSTGQ